MGYKRAGREEGCQMQWLSLLSGSEPPVYPQSTIIQSSRILKEGEDKEKRKDERSVFVCVGGRLEEWEE